MNEPIQTLLFDFGGTLDANGVAWKERFYAFYRAEGLDMTADAFQSSFFAADSALVGNLPPATDLSGTVHALVDNLELELARHSPGANEPDMRNPGIGARSARVASRFLSEAAAAFARNRPVLRELGERYRLGVVSNFYGNLEAVCQDAGLASLFSVLVDSYWVGAEKPDPAIFRVALAALGASPETTVLIGDSLRRDGEGARRTGMRFIWLMRQATAAPETREWPEPPVEHAVAKIGDLMRILK
jgi:FMN hydrolase / 5-amino-6-(5-phospho-D-ribitylamino)uracil phosphatase